MSAHDSKDPTDAVMIAVREMLAKLEQSEPGSISTTDLLGLSFDLLSHWILDGEGEPQETDFITWGLWFEMADRQIADDHFGEVRVSTVFIGCSAILFESMIFGGPRHGECRRFRTRNAALAGHAGLCELAKATLQ